MKTKLVGFISATALALAAATPALATQLASGSTNWDFATLLHDSGATANASLNTFDTFFTQPGQSIEARSMLDQDSPNGSWVNSTMDLWYKDGTTAEEQGLGLAGDSNGGGGEIYSPYGIQLDLTGGGAVFSSVGIGSVQTGETYEVWGYAGGQWQSLASGSGGGIVNINLAGVGNFTQLIISDPYTKYQTQTSSNDIVLMSVSTVPEPGTLALLAFGLAAVGFAVSRRRKAGSEA